MGKRESRELLIEECRLVRQRVRGLIQIGDADVALARRLADRAHRVDDRRAFGAENGDRFVDALDEGHDVLHRPSDRPAAGFLFRGGALEMFGRIADGRRLLADFARRLRLLLRRGRGLLHHLGDFFDCFRRCGAAARLLFGCPRDLGH